jgi:hypothetical protein
VKPGFVDGIDEPEVHSVYRVYLVGQWLEPSYQQENRVNLCHNTHWIDINTLYCELRDCIYTDLLPLQS